MTSKVFVQCTQPIAAGQPAYGSECGAMGTVLVSNGADQQPTFQAAPGSAPGGAPNAVQYNNAGAFGGIGPGNARQILITPTNGTAPAWGGFSGARVRKAVAAAVSASAPIGAAITWDTADYDTDAYHDNVVSPSRLTVPFTGYYMLVGMLNYTAVGFLTISIVINGATNIASFYPGSGTPNQPRFLISSPYLMTAGDYAELYGFSSAGGNTQNADGPCFFSASYMGP